MRTLPIFLSVLMTSVGVSATAQTQQIDPNQSQQAPFASENAIIDTSIPFAIGAREAQQSLRGSFGWPTFQEGLVHGVYFRFDPDGYARFAPTPRLDTDVFEVICRPRTYSCMGRKGPLSIILNSRGQIQLKIDDVLSGDRFFVSEGVSEIEVPERILQPLDTQLELLLSTGGDLIVRRGDTEKDRISLTGFMPVTAYLRWVTARQDYTILPRGWPIPNAANSDSAMTQSTTWQSPMPQPQNFPNTQGGITVNLQQPVSQPLQAQPQATQTASTSTQSEVDEVKSELRILRELLMEKNKETQPAQMPTQQPLQTGSIGQLMPQNSSQPPVNDQIAALQAAASQIQADIQRLTQPQKQTPGGLGTIGLGTPQHQDPMQHNAKQQMVQDPAIETAKRLQYLMSEIGLDAKTALMLIQMGEGNQSQDAMMPANATTNAQQTPQNPASQDNIVAQILRELESDLGETQAQTEPMKQDGTLDLSDAEFQLLSQYFKSVVIPR